jgi:integrase
LAAIQAGVKKLGYSVEVAEQLAGAVTKSSQEVYEKKWQYFQSWCHDNNVKALEAKDIHVADFLQHLHKEKSLKPSTIKGYRSALGKVLSYNCNTNLSLSPVLADLISSFEHAQAHVDSRFPKWDLVLVLDSFTREPYEPMNSCSLKFLTFKLLFLIMFGGGGRIGETHALDIANITHEGKWEKVMLRPNPIFVAKNYDYSSGQRNFEGFQLEALKHRLGPGLEEEVKLCPVRALKYYLKRTEKLRGQERQLFISIKPGNKKKGVGKNTMASWVKQAILKAYENCSPEILRKMKISSHEVRALATSTAFYGNTALKEILKSARWSQQTTFTSFYLRDVSQDMQEVYRLGPLLVAQQKL